jgi:DNA-binding NtrC family response regulator
MSEVPPQAPPAPLPRLLVVDDEESMRHSLQRGLRRAGFEVECAQNGEAALGLWVRSPFDAAIVDLRMPGQDGLTVLSRILASDPDAIVVLISAYGTIQSAVDAMQVGATDFLTKPFEVDELAARLRRALQLRQLRRENTALRRLLEEPAGRLGLVGQSQAITVLLHQIELIRDSTATVLITGEPGTGKSLAARALHAISPRAAEPFVALHCSTVPENLLESEIFGHEAGAFTGAVRPKSGLVTRAHRGTLLLDEIANLSLGAQAKIEQFLADREFTPLGATRPQRVDVRILATTNVDVDGAIRTGVLRQSLVLRLDVVRLHVPPLRDRREDIPLLVAHRLRSLAERDHREVKSLTPEALAALVAHEWPGNVRELENVVERMAVLAGDRPSLGIGDLPAFLREQPEAALDAGDYENARRRFDHAYFRALLARCDGNVTEAARVAGLSRGHLHRRLRELDEGAVPRSEP